jgi:predicted unusual protein kinase regulating ubiquinone biosynthesis (AarF/ABC1/UbiB family)
VAPRVALSPPHWIAEFEKLQAQVPPVPFAQLLPELERSLGRSPFEVFRDLDARAYGAASIAQVHRAKLPDGTERAATHRQDWRAWVRGLPEALETLPAGQMMQEQ